MQWQNLPVANCVTALEGVIHFKKIHYINVLFIPQNSIDNGRKTQKPNLPWFLSFPESHCNGEIYISTLLVGGSNGSLMNKVNGRFFRHTKSAIMLFTMIKHGVCL